MYGIHDKASGKWLLLKVMPNNRLNIVVAYLYLCLVEELGGYNKVINHSYISTLTIHLCFIGMPLQSTTDCGSETTTQFAFASLLQCVQMFQYCSCCQAFIVRAAFPLISVNIFTQTSMPMNPPHIDSSEACTTSPLSEGGFVSGNNGVIMFIMSLRKVLNWAFIIMPIPPNSKSAVVLRVPSVRLITDVISIAHWHSGSGRPSYNGMWRMYA